MTKTKAKKQEKRLERVKARKEKDFLNAVMTRKIVFNTNDVYFKGKNTLSTLNKQMYKQNYIKKGNGKIGKISLFGEKAHYKHDGFNMYLMAKHWSPNNPYLLLE